MIQNETNLVVADNSGARSVRVFRLLGGSFRKKALYVKDIARILEEEYSGIVPKDREILMKFPGVGRKTANVFLSEYYNEPYIAVDTHVFRVSRRIGLSDGTNVEAVERDLTEGFAPELRPKAHHWLILHGRYVCVARKPKCEECGLNGICKESLK